MVAADREPPLTFAAIEPLLVDSRLARLIRRVLSALAGAVAAAGTIAIADRTARLGAGDRAALVASAAWLIAIAAITHIAMLLFVERYHFPSRAALVLPAVITVVALVAVWLSDAIARAFADRHHR